MFTVTNTQTRPSVSTAWWSDAQPEVKTIFTALNSEPEIVNYVYEVSENGLITTRTYTFNSDDDYQTWIGKIMATNPLVLQQRNDYIVANGLSLKIEESVDGGTPVIEKLL